MSIDMAPTSKDIEREADVSRAELAEHTREPQG